MVRPHRRRLFRWLQPARGRAGNLQSAVIEAVRQRGAFLAVILRCRFSHDITRVGYYSEPLNSSHGLAQSVTDAIESSIVGSMSDGAC